MLCSFLVFVQLECRFGVLVQSVVLCNVGLMQIHACVELMQKSIRFIERAEKVKRALYVVRPAKPQRSNTAETGKPV